MSVGGAPVEYAFIFDTHRLSHEVLGAAGLERDDTAASDHLPVVVDILWPPEGER